LELSTAEDAVVIAMQQGTANKSELKVRTMPICTDCT